MDPNNHWDEEEKQASSDDKKSYYQQLRAFFLPIKSTDSELVKLGKNTGFYVFGIFSYLSP